MIEREKKILDCAGHLSPEGICRVFGLAWSELITLCHKHKFAFDVSQVHKYPDSYRAILQRYLDESRQKQGFKHGQRVDIDQLIESKNPRLWELVGVETNNKK